MLTGMRSGGLMFPDTAQTPAGPVDPYYSYVYALYHLDTDYTDSGPGGRTLQASGTSANFGVSTTSPKFGTGSLRSVRNASATALIKIPPSAALNSTGDLTFEFYCKGTYTAGSYSNLFETLGAANLSATAPPVDALGVANWTNAAGTGLGGTTLTMYLGSGSTQLRLTSTSTPNDNVWHHIALTRSGTTCRLWFDGTAQATGTYTAALDLGGTYGMSVARYTNTDGTNIYNGYLDDIRITLGVCRYTSNFTVPTAAFPNSA